VTLGKVGTLTPEQARTLARKTLGAVAHGSDPAALKAAERRASTLRELAEIFLAEHVEAKRKSTTAAHYRSPLEKVVPPKLGSRKAEQVTTSDLAKLHTKMRDRPCQGNRMLELIGSLNTFAGKRKIFPLGFNSARGIERYPEKRRERFLTADELTRLGDAIREAGTVGLPYKSSRRSQGKARAQGSQPADQSRRASRPYGALRAACKHRPFRRVRVGIRASGWFSEYRVDEGRHDAPFGHGDEPSENDHQDQNGYQPELLARPHEAEELG
jgi:hypothetical protein